MGRRRTFLGAAGVLMIGCSTVLAESCVEPEPSQIQSATIYLARKYNLISVSDIQLLQNRKENDGCFWRLDFMVRKNPVTVYLSPDRAFLTTDVFDLGVDPRVEKKRQEEETARTLAAGDPPWQGRKDAPVTIVEFSDFECPYCKRFEDIFNHELPQADRENVRLVFRHFPLPMHPWAQEAALLAACVGLQSQASFWKAHDFLFDNQKELTAENIEQRFSALISTDAQIDRKQYQTCAEKQLTLGMVTKDQELGRKNNVRATPTIFINGVRYQGVSNAAQLREIVESAALSKDNTQATPVGTPSSR